MKKLWFLYLIVIICLTGCVAGEQVAPSSSDLLQQPISSSQIKNDAVPSSSSVLSAVPPLSSSQSNISQNTTSSSDSSSSQLTSSSTPPAFSSQPESNTANQYRNQSVKSLYAVDTNSYVMAKVDDSLCEKEILSHLEQESPDGSNANGLAYLVYTDKGRTYVYLNDTHTWLNENCQNLLASKPLHPGWLIHMTPEKIVKINGVNDKETIQAFCAYLKDNIIVTPQTTSSTGPVNPSTVQGLFTIKIDFDTGGYYHIIGYDYLDGTGKFTLYSSDLDTHIQYQFVEGNVSALIQFLATYHQS